MVAPLVVHHRVDALVVGFRLAIGRAQTCALRSRAAVATRHGRASYVDASGRAWELRPAFRGDGCVFRLFAEDYAMVELDVRAPRPTLGQIVTRPDGSTEELRCDADEPGWSVAIQWRARYLATHALREVLRESREIARAWGIVREERLRRIDLAADVAGFDLRPEDWRHVVRKQRTTIHGFCPTRGDGDGWHVPPPQPRGAEPLSTSEVSGWRVGRGDVVARAYDKTEECLSARDPVRLLEERSRWRAGGWDGVAPVTRVEFQVRGAVLRELGARSLLCRDPRDASAPYQDLDAYVPRLWASCLAWCRLGAANDAGQRASRRRTDPRWAPLDRLAWCGAPPAAPIRRLRTSGPVAAAQVVGTAIRYLADRDELGELGKLPERLPDGASPSVADLARVLLGLAGAAGAACAPELVARWESPRNALEHLGVLVHAAVARNAYRVGEAATNRREENEDRERDSRNVGGGPGA